MKRITLMGLAVLVVLGIMAATSGAEGTGPKVTLRTAAGPLKKHALLVAFSTDLELVTSGGNQECTHNTLSGTLATNTKEKLSGEITLAESFGEENVLGGRCPTTGTFGRPSAEWQNLPWKFKFINTGEVQVKTGVGDKRIKIAYTFPEAGGAKCSYLIKKLLLSFPVSATPVPLVVKTPFPEPRFTLVPGSTAGCPTEGKLRGKFSTTSNGEAVEVEVK
jgi:hypothetical protein